MKWRAMLEQNGELNDASRALLRQMERYASSVGCRHRHLSEYFGDRYEKEGCGGCDYCLNELEPAAEPVVVARKILSCVARVGQRFGSTHVASVLRGQASEQVVARGHDKLSTFGLLPDAGNAEVRGLHRTVDRRRAAAAVRWRLPRSCAHSERARAAEGSGERAWAGACQAAAAAQRRAAPAVARRGRVVAQRRSRSLRAPALGAARDRALAGRSAVRHLPRRDAARDGAPASHVDRRAARQ